MNESERRRVHVLVPARGGSKRIPRKNVRPFLGRPAIEHVLDTIARAGFAAPFVSTDDDEIAAIARSAGAHVPFLRPPELATDTASTLVVVRHALAELTHQGVEIDDLLVVYPTALLLTAERLKEGLRAFHESDADFLVPVLPSLQPIERALRITGRGRLQPVQPDALGARTQDLPGAYFDAGQFYFGRTHSWLKDGPLSATNTLPMVLSSTEVVDIDTEDDWRLVEKMAGGGRV